MKILDVQRKVLMFLVYDKSKTSLMNRCDGSVKRNFIDRQQQEDQLLIWYLLIKKPCFCAKVALQIYRVDIDIFCEKL